MFIRFETVDRDARSGKYIGIFTLSSDLLHGHDLENYQREKLKELMIYFGKELPVPDKFSSSKSKGAYRRNQRGISWLKAEAVDMVSKFRELKMILEEYGYPIEVIKIDFVGKIIYSDQYQVVAE